MEQVDSVIDYQYLNWDIYHYMILDGIRVDRVRDEVRRQRDRLAYLAPDEKKNLKKFIDAIEKAMMDTKHERIKLERQEAEIRAARCK